MIDKNQFFALSSDLEPVNVEGFGVVYVKSMTAKQRDILELEQARMMRENKEMGNIRGRLLAQCVVDENGNRVFTDEDAEKIGDMPASVIQPIFNKVMELNSFSEKDIDELSGN